MIRFANLRTVDRNIMFIDTLDLKLKVFVQLSKIQKQLTTSSKIYFSYYGDGKFSLADIKPTFCYSNFAIATIAQNTKPYELYTIVESLVDNAICKFIKLKPRLENRFVA
jgi:hypothetical protein